MTPWAKILEDIAKQEENKQEEFKVEVFAMVYICTKEEAWKICSEGFSDQHFEAGAIGNGIYLSGNFESAFYSVPESNQFGVVSLVIPGNAFPVTEHPQKDEKGRNIIGIDDTGEIVLPNPTGYFQKDIRQSYQSHFSIVARKDPITQKPLDHKETFPVNEAYVPHDHREQLVVKSPRQLLPIFIVQIGRIQEEMQFN